MNEPKAFKYSGAGNIIIVAYDEKRSEPEKRKLAQQFCDFRKSSAADGILFLKNENADIADFSWDFYNADGSTAEMCGNAARCATQFCLEELAFPEEMIRFKTLAGIIRCEKKSDNEYQVQMSSPRVLDPSLSLTVGDRTEKFFFIDTGVPHLVFETSEDIFSWRKDSEKKNWAKRLRQHPLLPSHGANVTFVQKLKEKNRAMTFERGVEDFTAACGTGAVAAAFFFHQKEKREFHDLLMPGGLLKVNLKNENCPLLIGPSQKIREVHLGGE